MLFRSITPEAYEGGTIGLVHDGDLITLDAEKNEITLHVSDEELTERRKTWTPLVPPFIEQGVLRKYFKNVSPADLGCVTDL